MLSGEEQCDAVLSKRAITDQQYRMFAITFELARVQALRTVELPSIAPLLHENRTFHDAVFCYYLSYQRSVPTARHKLIVYPKARQVQFFDLTEDPWETHNLAVELSMIDVKRDLWARRRSFQKELGDPMVLQESSGQGIRD